jgi:hypothetical protein
MYSATYDDVLSQAAQALGMDLNFLYNVIMAESGWSPSAYNASSGAVGLIQFIPRTLLSMNLLSADLAARIPASGAVPDDVKRDVAQEFLMKYPTVTAQLLGPILQYFKPYRPFPTEQSVYLTVFYPAYRSNPLDTIFPANVQAQNPGITTVGDYVDFVKKKSKMRKSSQPESKPSLSSAPAQPFGTFSYVEKKGDSNL